MDINDRLLEQIADKLEFYNTKDMVELYAMIIAIVEKELVEICRDNPQTNIPEQYMLDRIKALHGKYKA